LYKSIVRRQLSADIGRLIIGQCLIGTSLVGMLRVLGCCWSGSRKHIWPVKVLS